jgi:hypothetical protein
MIRGLVTGSAPHFRLASLRGFISTTLQMGSGDRAGHNVEKLLNCLVLLVDLGGLLCVPIAAWLLHRRPPFARFRRPL